MQLWANVRPVKNFPNVPSPLPNVKDGDIDWVLVRENSEGEYCGHGGRTHRGQPWEAATELSIFTRVGVERIMRFAFDVARSRPRKLLTVITKSNAMRNGMVLWDEVALEVSKDYPDVKWDKLPLVILTLPGRTLRFSSLSMEAHLILPERELPTRLLRFGRHLRCFNGWERRRPLISCRELPRRHVALVSALRILVERLLPLKWRPRSLIRFRRFLARLDMRQISWFRC